LIAGECNPRPYQVETIEETIETIGEIGRKTLLAKQDTETTRPPQKLSKASKYGHQVHLNDPDGMPPSGSFYVCRLAHPFDASALSRQ
jgi:hypothetical protein